MVYRWRLVIALACMMLLALAGQVFAGGVVVTLDQMPAGVRPGQPFDVGFMIISAHNGQGISGQRPALEAINPQTNEVIKQTGRPDGPVGHYIARMTLPSEGEWRWTIQPFTDAQGYPASELTPLVVKALPEVAPDQVASVAQQGAFQRVTVGRIGAVALLAFLALALLTFALRSRIGFARS